MNFRILMIISVINLLACKPPAAPSTVSIDKKPTGAGTSGVQNVQASPIPTSQQLPVPNQPAPAVNPYAYQSPAPTLQPYVIPVQTTPNPACQQAAQVQGATGILGAAQGIFTGNWVNAIAGVITTINRPQCN